MASASSSSMPSSVSATTSCGPLRRPAPVMIRTPWLSSSRRDLIVEVGFDLGHPPALGIHVEAGVLVGEAHALDARVKLMAPPVAIMVLDGMQSHRWAAPPTMSRSIRVTSAPRRAACGRGGVAARAPADDHHPDSHRQRLGW